MCISVYFIFRTGAKCVIGEKQDTHGVGSSYHELKILRTKPGRGTPTRSMSCSDKMMKWNIMGCQGALMMSFLDQPIYVSSFVTIDHGTSISSMKRALVERVPSEEIYSLLRNTPYRFNQPQIIGTNLWFKYSKSGVLNSSPCGSAISWCDVSNNNYDVISKNGLRLGVIKKHRSSPKAVSSVSRLELFKLFKLACQKLESKNCSINKKFLKCETYDDFKCLIQYSDVWRRVRNKVFPNWVVHDKSLDQFSS